MSDLRNWLKEQGLERYAEAFEREEIALDVLPDLTEKDLERIGLPLGPRKTLLRAAAGRAHAWPAARRSHSSLVLVLVLVVAAAIVAGVFGVHYWISARDQARIAEVEAALNAANSTTQELDLARERQLELVVRVRIARLAEDNARGSGDEAKLKQLQDLTRRAEAEAAKQAEIVRQREAEVKAAEEAARIADAKKQSDQARAAEKAVQEKAAAEKLAAEKAAAEKAAAEKQAAAEKAAKLAAASPLEQFMARNTQYRFLPRDPPGGTLPYMEIVFVTDDSCPRGEIKELTGGNNQLGIARKSRCVKLVQ
jgi:hypothetical protein